MKDYEFVSSYPYYERKMVSKGGLIGFIHASFSQCEIIPCKYIDAKPFIFGLACVKKENGWTVINLEGKELTDELFDYVDILKNGTIYVKSNGKCGVLGRNGESIVPIIFDSIDYYDNCCLYKVYKLSLDKYGIYDSSGNIVAYPIYTELEIYSRDNIVGYIGSCRGIIK